MKSRGILIVTGLLYFMVPSSASAGAPQYPQAHRVQKSDAAIRRPIAPRAPRQDQLKDGFGGFGFFCSVAPWRPRGAETQPLPSWTTNHLTAGASKADGLSSSSSPADHASSLPPSYAAFHLLI